MLFGYRKRVAKGWPSDGASSLQANQYWRAPWMHLRSLRYLQLLTKRSSKIHRIMLPAETAVQMDRIVTSPTSHGNPHKSWRQGEATSYNQGKEQEALEINLAVSKVKVERLLESKMRRGYQLQPRQKAGGTWNQLGSIQSHSRKTASKSIAAHN